jgi:hypothetical protein
VPLGFLLEGGQEVGEDDGAPRLFRPDEVQQINAALAPTSDEELWGRLDPELMEAESVYPGIWDEEEEELREEYLKLRVRLREDLDSTKIGVEQTAGEAMPPSKLLTGRASSRRLVCAPGPMTLPFYRGPRSPGSSRPCLVRGMKKRPRAPALSMAFLPGRRRGHH